MSVNKKSIIVRYIVLISISETTLHWEAVLAFQYQQGHHGSSITEKLGDNVPINLVL